MFGCMNGRQMDNGWVNGLWIKDGWRMVVTGRWIMDGWVER